MAASKGTPGAQGERNPLRMVLFILSIGLCLFGFYSILDFQSSVQAQLSGELILGQVDSASYNHKDSPVLGFLFEYFGILTYLFALMIVYLGYFLVLKPVDIWHADFYKACLRLLGFNFLLIGLAGVLSRTADLGTTGAGGLLGDMLNMFFDLALPGLLSVFIFAITAFCGLSMLMGRNPFFLFDGLGEVFFKVLPARSRKSQSESVSESELQERLAAGAQDDGIDARALAAGGAGAALAAGALGSEAQAAGNELQPGMSDLVIPLDDPADLNANGTQANGLGSSDALAFGQPVPLDDGIPSLPDLNGERGDTLSLQQGQQLQDLDAASVAGNGAAATGAAGAADVAAAADAAGAAAAQAHSLRLPDDLLGDMGGAGDIPESQSMGGHQYSPDMPDHVNNMDDAFLQAAVEAARDQELEGQDDGSAMSGDFFGNVITGEHGRMSPDLKPDYNIQEPGSLNNQLDSSIQDAAALEHEALNSSDPDVASDFFSGPIVSDAEQRMAGGVDALEGEHVPGDVSPMPDLGDSAPVNDFFAATMNDAMRESMAHDSASAPADAGEAVDMGNAPGSMRDSMGGMREGINDAMGADYDSDQFGRAADNISQADDAYRDFAPEAGAPDTLGADQGGIQGIAADDSFASWQDEAQRAADSAQPDAQPSQDQNLRSAAPSTEVDRAADDLLPVAGEFYDEAANAAADASEGMTSDSSVAAARSAISAAAAAAAGRAAAAGFTGAAGAAAAHAAGSAASGPVMALSAAADHFRDRAAADKDAAERDEAARREREEAKRLERERQERDDAARREREEAERKEREEAERREREEAERKEREETERREREEAERKEREEAERREREEAERKEREEAERREREEAERLEREAAEAAAAEAAAAEAAAQAAAEAEAARAAQESGKPEGADENSPYGYGTYAATHKLRREREDHAAVAVPETTEAQGNEEEAAEENPGAVHTIVQRTDPEVFAAQQEARRKEREEAERREREEAERKEREEAERKEREEAERKEREEAERRDREEAERKEREEAERKQTELENEQAATAAQDSQSDNAGQDADDAEQLTDGASDEEEEAPIYAGTYAAKLARERAAQEARSGRKNRRKSDDLEESAQDAQEHKEEQGPSTIIRDTRREFEEAQAARAAQAKAAQSGQGAGAAAAAAAAGADGAQESGSVEVNMFGSDDADSPYEPRHAYDFGSGQKAGQLDESLSGTSSSGDSDDDDEGYFAGAAMHDHSEDSSDDADDDDNENIIAFDSIGKEDSGYEVGALTSAFIPVPDDNHAPVRQTPVRSGSASVQEKSQRTEKAAIEAAHVAQEEKKQTADSAGNTYATAADTDHDDLASWAGAVASALNEGSAGMENQSTGAAQLNNAGGQNMEPAGQFVPVPEGQTLAGAQAGFGNNGQPVQYMQMPNGQVVPVMPGAVNQPVNSMPGMGQYVQLPNGQVMPFVPGNMNQGMIYQGQLNGMMNPAMANGMHPQQAMQGQAGFSGQQGLAGQQGFAGQSGLPGQTALHGMMGQQGQQQLPLPGQQQLQNQPAAAGQPASAGQQGLAGQAGMPEAGNNFMGAHNSSTSNLPSYMAGVAQGQSPVSEPRGSRALCTVPRRKYDSWRPSLDLLARSNSHVSEDLEELNKRAELINEVLQSFGVKATVADYLTGPVITRFDLDLAPGVKTSAISSIETELCRNLMVPNIRVVPIIDGSSYVGLEVPNTVRRFITLADMAESREFQETTSSLPMCLGASVTGSPVVKDLAEAPHLLVAGTTGSGKSAGLNTMLISMLLKCSPAELRLILVDPKQLEFSIYKDLPHLITPVITDVAEKTPVALNWCVDEMERRFKLMSMLGVRKLSEFNEMVRREAQAGRSIADPLWTVDQGPHPQALEPLPCIVVVVEEFADLMAQSGRKKDKEGTPEGLIARLSAKSRAAGIHLVLVTQTPRSEVVTGTIKANFPSRVAFTVQNRLDSTIVLDEKGAETLLGNGDMLYKFTGSSTATRAHGAFTSNDDVRAVVEAWREHAGAPEYLEDVIYVPEEEHDEPGEARARERELDVKFDAAAALAREYLELRGKPPTVSDLQTELGVGFPRAKKIHMQLMREGVFN